MGNVADKTITLAPGDLVPAGIAPGVMALDFFLAAAADVMPDFLTSLLTQETLDATRQSYARVAMAAQEARKTAIAATGWPDYQVDPDILRREQAIRDRLIADWAAWWGLPFGLVRHAAEEAIARMVRDPEAEPRFPVRSDHQTLGGVIVQRPGDPPLTKEAIRERIARQWVNYGTGPRLDLADVGSILREITFDPTQDTADDFRRRFHSWIDHHLTPEIERVHREYVAAGCEPAMTKRQMEHFIWLARKLIAGETPAEIAGIEGPDIRTVERGIAEAARALGLNPPRRKPGPKAGSRQRRH